jgi:peptidyl-prolyl cis-trans isomerase C
VHDELRQQMVQAAVQKEISDVRGQVSIERFNPDGSTVKATDTAEPPAAAEPAPAAEPPPASK